MIGVPLPEVPSGGQRNSGGGKVILGGESIIHEPERYRFTVDPRVLAGPVAREGHRPHDAGGFDTRERLDPCLDLPVEAVGLFGPSILCAGDRNAECEHSRGLEAGLDALHPRETLNQQSRPDQQHDGQRHLTNHEAVPHAPTPSTRGPPVPEFGPRIGPHSDGSR